MYRQEGIWAMINIFRFMCHPRFVEFRGAVECGRKARVEAGSEKRHVTIDEHHVPRLVKDAGSDILLTSYQESPR